MKKLFYIFIVIALIAISIILWAVNENRDAGIGAQFTGSMITVITHADLYYNQNKTYTGFDEKISDNLTKKCKSNPVISIGNDGQSISLYAEGCEGTSFDNQYVCISRVSGKPLASWSPSQFTTLPLEKSVNSLCQSIDGVVQ